MFWLEKEEDAKFNSQHSTSVDYIGLIDGRFLATPVGLDTLFTVTLAQQSEAQPVWWPTRIVRSVKRRFIVGFLFCRICSQRTTLNDAVKSGTRCQGAKAQPLWRFRRFPEILIGLKLGVRYRRAAERDEKNGFPFTAAMEWRKAADLFSPIPQLSNRCWQEWERVMHLPRRLAGSIVEPAEVSTHNSLTYDTQKITNAILPKLPAELAA